MKYEMCAKYAGKLLKNENGDAFIILDNNYNHEPARFSLYKYNMTKAAYSIMLYNLSDELLQKERLYTANTNKKLYLDVKLGDRYVSGDHVYYLCEINHIGIQRYCVTTEDGFSRVHREIFDTIEEVHEYMIGRGYSHYAS